MWALPKHIQRLAVFLKSYLTTKESIWGISGGDVILGRVLGGRSMGLGDGMCEHGAWAMRIRGAWGCMGGAWGVHGCVKQEVMLV